MKYTQKFKEIESFSKQIWDNCNISKVKLDESKEKMVILDFFPYPSGVGLHIGHMLGYVATDIYARWRKLEGKNVLFAMGFDSFGLPAEQFAIEHNKHPEVITQQNINNIKKQLKDLSFMHDESRCFNTTDQDYYKWTQWIFLKLYNSYFDEKQNKAIPILVLQEKLKQEGKTQEEIKKTLDSQRLAFLDEVEVNWCAGLGTVLAHEEVIGGKSERGNFPVIKRPLKQWVLRITKYSKRLLENLDALDWPESIKEMQKNWIGISTGYEVEFKTDINTLPVFTTRLDTLSGVSFCAISIKHKEIKKFAITAQAKEFIAKEEVPEDFAVFTGVYAYNPLTNKKIPVYIASYVLPYAQGAVMGVPAHDSRDFKFAKENALKIVPVIKPTQEFLNENAIKDFDFWESPSAPFEGKNKLYNGNTYEEEMKMLSQYSWATQVENTKLHDWIFSRQRYWGEPFPIIFDAQGEAYALDESQLPVILPEMENYSMQNDSDEIKKPLDNAHEWKNIKFIKLESGAKIVETEESDIEHAGNVYEVYEGTRETNTMPNWAGSCWYYLRYMDPQNADAFVSKKAEKYWGSSDKLGAVDLYLGGAEHAVLHLLYARFWHMVLYDLNEVSSKEPFNKLFNQGMILGAAYKNEDGKYFALDDIEKIDEKHYAKSTKEELSQSFGKIGKRYKNGIAPEDICNQYGIDTIRLYLMYLGPLEQNKPWDYTSIKGMSRLLDKLYTLKVENCETTNEVQHDFNKMLEKINKDLEQLKFNTAIAAFIIFLNSVKVVSHETYKKILIVFAPFAPHICEYLFQKQYKNDSIFLQNWPNVENVEFTQSDIKLVITINGKKLDILNIAFDVDVEDVIKNYANEKKISYKKYIIIKDKSDMPKLVNFIV